VPGGAAAQASGDSSDQRKKLGALYAHLSLKNPCAARAYVFAMLTSDTERAPKVALIEVLRQLMKWCLRNASSFDHQASGAMRATPSKAWRRPREAC